jgi:hypothetical protein
MNELLLYYRQQYSEYRSRYIKTDIENQRLRKHRAIAATALGFTAFASWLSHLL